MDKNTAKHWRDGIVVHDPPKAPHLPRGPNACISLRHIDLPLPQPLGQTSHDKQAKNTRRSGERQRLPEALGRLCDGDTDSEIHVTPAFCQDGVLGALCPPRRDVSVHLTQTPSVSYLRHKADRDVDPVFHQRLLRPISVQSRADLLAPAGGDREIRRYGDRDYGSFWEPFLGLLSIGLSLERKLPVAQCGERGEG